MASCHFGVMSPVFLCYPQQIWGPQMEAGLWAGPEAWLRGFAGLWAGPEAWLTGFAFLSDSVILEDVFETT